MVALGTKFSLHLWTETHANLFFRAYVFLPFYFPYTENLMNGMGEKGDSVAREGMRKCEHFRIFSVSDTQWVLDS